MDGVGEVDGGGPGGQALHVPVGGEHKHLVGEHVHPEGADKLVRVGVLLALQQLAHPLEFPLGAQPLVGQPLLVFPVGGHAVLRRLVHLPGADLHLEGDALPAHHGGVQGLVAVGLGGADIVLEPAQHRLEHVVDTAQHVIAGGYVVHDHPEGVQVEDFIEGFALGVHFAVDGIDVLEPPVHPAFHPLLRQPLLDVGLHVVHKAGVEGGDVGQLRLHIVVAHRVQVLQGQVLQLPLQLLHAQAVGDGGVDLHGLQGLLLLLGVGLVLEGAHIVQPVAQLDEDDPHVLGHGHEHLAKVLHLLVLPGGILHPGELGDALHQVGDLGGEQPGDVVVGGVGVLNAVVEEGRDDGVLVQLQLVDDLRHGDGVDDIGLPAFAQLGPVVVVGIFKGCADALSVRRWVGGQDIVLQRFVFLMGQIHYITPPWAVVSAVNTGSYIIAPFCSRNSRRRRISSDCSRSTLRWGWDRHSRFSSRRISPRSPIT